MLVLHNKMQIQEHRTFGVTEIEHNGQFGGFLEKVRYFDKMTSLIRRSRPLPGTKLGHERFID